MAPQKRKASPKKKSSIKANAARTKAKHVPKIRTRVNSHGLLDLYKDYFPHMQRKHYNLEWASNNMAWAAAAFGLRNPITGRIIMDHSCTRITTNNVMAFQTQVHDVILGPKMNDPLKESFFEWFGGKMDEDVSGKKKTDGKTDEVPFSFQGEKPRNFKDVMKVLFRRNSKATKMIREGKIAPVMAIVYLWCFYVMMQKAPICWIVRGLEKHFANLNLPLALCDEKSDPESPQETHGLIRFAKKKVITPFQQMVVDNMEKQWGLKLCMKNNFKPNEDIPPGFFEVNLRRYLPSEVLDIMKRKNGTIFRVEVMNAKKELLG